MLHWTKSGDLMIMIIIGGTGTLIGPALGAAVLVGLETFLTSWTEHWKFFLGPDPDPDRAVLERRVDVACSRVGGASVSEPLLQVDGLTKRFGGLVAANNLSLDVAEGELHALIGPNGAGKTTFISQLAGELAPGRGRHPFRRPRDQRLEDSGPRSARARALVPDHAIAAGLHHARQRRARACRRIADIPISSDEDARKVAKFRDEGRRHLDRVGLGTRARHARSNSSHGEQKQLELAIALATSPRMLLLDEPMAGLGTAECAGMIELLKVLKTEMTILLVEHDMDAVFALADRISVLVNGERIATGPPTKSAQRGGSHRVSWRGRRLMLKVAGLQASYGRSRYFRYRPRSGRGRDRDTARPKRHGQDHHHPFDHGTYRAGEGALNSPGAPSRATRRKPSRAPASASCRKAGRCFRC